MKTLVEDLLGDIIEGKLTIDEAKVLLEDKPAAWAELSELYGFFDGLKEPRLDLTIDDAPFYQKLKPKPLWPSVLGKIAAGVAVLSGAFAMGFYLKPEKQRPMAVKTEIQRETVYVKTPTETRIVYKNLPELEGIKKEVVRIDQTQKELLFAMLSASSASDRISGVQSALSVKSPSDTLLAALINTLNTDPNANVRLAVVDAMEYFGKKKLVREQLVESLKRQNDESVQVAMIDLLSQFKERRAAPVFATLALSSQSSELLKLKAEQGMEAVLY